MTKLKIEKSKFKKFFPAFLVTFVNVLGFSLLLPVFPFLIKQYNEPATILGILAATYSAFQFIGSPLMGSLSDKYGRKPILMITHFGTFLSWLILCIAYFLVPIKVFGLMTLPMIVILFSRMTDGITGGNMSVTQAYIADITEKHEKAKYFGYIGATFGIGLIVGPAIGSVAMSTSYGYLGTAILGATISLITLILMYAYLVESLPQSKRKEEIDIHILKSINIYAKIKKYSENKIILSAFFFKLILGVVMSGFTTIMSLYVIEMFGLTELELGYFLFFVGSFLIFNQLVLVKPFTNKLGNLKTLILAQFLIFIGLMTMSFATTLTIFIILYYTVNLGITLSMPTIAAILSNNTEAKNQGEIMGLNESIMSLTMIIIPIFIAYIYTITPKNFVFQLMSVVPVIGLFIYYLTLHKYMKKLNYKKHKLD
jgi:DHA1 family tetracycline resistance protein-like MFS transporter